jgi:hypothetical protein
MQTKKFSLLESVTQTVAAFMIALITQSIVFPLYGFDAPLRTEIEIALIFTAISIPRSYIIRRIFTRFLRHEV